MIKELWHTNNPTTRQEALKALGEVDVKGWGIKRWENSCPAIKEDCRGEVITGMAIGWAAYRYSE